MTTPFTPVSPDRAVGGGNPPQDMNNTALELLAMGGGANVLDATYAGGADATGTADSATAFNDAIAALPGGGGYIYVPPGTYKLGSTVGPLTTNQWIVCASGVRFDFTGTGDCFRWVDTSTYTTRTVQGGGITGRPLIDGASAGAGSNALHFGDILGFRFDVAVQNFTGAGDIAIYGDNQNYWTEQAVGIAYVSNCTQDAVFNCGGATTSAGSFDRGDFTFYVQHKTFTGGVLTWQNGAYQVGGWVRLYGNINSSASTFSEAVVTLTGQAPGGHPASFSGLQCGIDINVESDEGLAHTFQTVNFGSTSNAVTGSFGSVNFGSGNLFAQSNVTSVSSQFTFLGPVIGDSTLEEINIPGRLSVNSEAFFFSSAYLAEISAPPTPTGGGIFYVDTSGNLHYLGPGAQDTTLASSGSALVVPGQHLCAPNPFGTTPGTFTTTSATLASLDSGAVCTNSFTAPPSGNVLVKAENIAFSIASDGNDIGFALCGVGDAPTKVGVMNSFEVGLSGGNGFPPTTLAWLITDLTPGDDYQFDLMFAVGGGTTLTVYYGDSGTLSGANRGTQIIMTVQAA